MKFPLTNFLLFSSARLSGEDPDDEELEEVEELERMTSLANQSLWTRLKKMVLDLVERVGFFGILVCASVSKPVLCGPFFSLSIHSYSFRLNSRATQTIVSFFYFHEAIFIQLTLPQLVYGGALISVNERARLCTQVRHNIFFWPDYHWKWRFTANLLQNIVTLRVLCSYESKEHTRCEEIV